MAYIGIPSKQICGGANAVRWFDGRSNSVPSAAAIDVVFGRFLERG